MNDTCVVYGIGSWSTSMGVARQKCHGGIEELIGSGENGGCIFNVTGFWHTGDEFGDTFCEREVWALNKKEVV